MGRCIVKFGSKVERERASDALVITVYTKEQIQGFVRYASVDIPGNSKPEVIVSATLRLEDELRTYLEEQHLVSALDIKLGKWEV